MPLTLYFKSLLYFNLLQKRKKRIVMNQKDNNTILFVGLVALATGLSILSLTRSGAVSSVNGSTGVIVLDTDDIQEGTTNKYFTDSLARDAISAGDYINYDSVTGTIGVDHSPAARAVYVDKSGNDSTGDGSVLKPLLTIQAAHTLATGYPASDYVNIYIGIGDYNEDVTVTRVKTALIGPPNGYGKATTISSLTVLPTVSVSGVFNDVIAVKNLLIEKGSGTSVITLGGNIQYTFYASHMFSFSSGSTTSCMIVTNTSSGGIRTNCVDCIFQNTNSNTSSVVITNTNNGRFDNCIFYGGSNSCLSITTGNITSFNTSFETNTGSNVINIVSSLGTPFNPITAPTGSIAFTGGNCTFLSAATNGSGIVIASGFTSTVAQSVFAIPAGTGSSVGGSSTCYFINVNNLVYPGTNSTVSGTVTRLNMTAL